MFIQNIYTIMNLFIKINWVWKVIRRLDRRVIRRIHNFESFDLHITHYITKIIFIHSRLLLRIHITSSFKHLFRIINEKLSPNSPPEPRSWLPVFFESNFGIQCVSLNFCLRESHLRTKFMSHQVLDQMLLTTDINN